MKVKDRLSKNFTIRLKADEFARLKREAKAAKMTVADYLRFCWQKVSKE